MRASWKIEKVERGGLLGSKTKYTVFTQLHLTSDEAALVAAYSPYDPRISDFVDLPEETEKKISFSFASSHQSGQTLEVDTIQVAGKYKDGVLKAFEEYKNQIDATEARISSLGKQHEVEID